jgi:hypothetical protein
MERRWKRALLPGTRPDAHERPGPERRGFRGLRSDPLFKANFPAPIPAYWSNYVATSDGQRFLVSALVPEAAASPINVVLNWTAGLKK